MDWPVQVYGDEIIIKITGSKKRWQAHGPDLHGVMFSVAGSSLQGVAKKWREEAEGRERTLYG